MVVDENLDRCVRILQHVPLMGSGVWTMVIVAIFVLAGGAIYQAIEPLGEGVELTYVDGIYFVFESASTMYVAAKKHKTKEISKSSLTNHSTLMPEAMVT
jgi:uncharacterized membrane protein HdeD (DUF308 family)